MWAAVNRQEPFVTVINPPNHTASRYFLCHCYFYFFTNKDCRLSFAPAHIRLDSSLWQGELHQICLGTEWKMHCKFCTILQLLLTVCWCWSTKQHQELSDINRLLKIDCENRPSIIMNISERLDSKFSAAWFLFPSVFFCLFFFFLSPLTSCYLTSKEILASIILDKISAAEAQQTSGNASAVACKCESHGDLWHQPEVC